MIVFVFNVLILLSITITYSYIYINICLSAPADKQSIYEIYVKTCMCMLETITERLLCLMRVQVLLAELDLYFQATEHSVLCVLCLTDGFYRRPVSVPQQ